MGPTPGPAPTPSEAPTAGGLRELPGAEPRALPAAKLSPKQAVQSQLRLRARGAGREGKLQQKRLRAMLEGPASPEEKLAYVASPDGTAALARMIESVDLGALVEDAVAFGRAEEKAARLEDARLTTKGAVAELFGRVGRLGREGVLHLKAKLSALREGLSAFLASPLQDKLRQLGGFVANNIPLLAPVVAPILAATAGAAVLPAFLAGLGFAGSMKAIELVLGHERLGLMPSLERLLPPDVLPIARATSTNAPELGSVVGTSLQSGMGLATSASGALMSNPWNTFFLIAAYVTALPKRVAKERERQAETGERPSFVRALMDVFKKTDWKALGTQLGYAVGFTADALLFFVAAGAGLGSWQMLAWLGANIPALAFFLHKTAFSQEARMKSAIGQLDAEALGRLQATWAEHFKDYGAMQTLLGGFSDMRGGDHSKAKLDEVRALIETVRKDIEAEPAFRDMIRALETSSPGNEDQAKMVSVLKALKIDPFDKKPLDKAALAQVVAGIAAFGLVATGLGASAEALGGALGLSVFVINSVAVAMASSLPEFGLTKKLFEEGKDFDAAYIEAASNATNIGFGILGAGLFGLRGLLKGG